jgi:hypothetical protein
VFRSELDSYKIQALSLIISSNKREKFVPNRLKKNVFSVPKVIMLTQYTGLFSPLQVGRSFILVCLVVREKEIEISVFVH